MWIALKKPGQGCRAFRQGFVVQLKRKLLGTGSPLHECPEGAATLKKPSEESLADYAKEPLDSCGTGRKEKSTYSKLQSWLMMRTSRFRMDI